MKNNELRSLDLLFDYTITFSLSDYINLSCEHSSKLKRIFFKKIIVFGICFTKHLNSERHCVDFRKLISLKKRIHMPDFF